MANPVATRLQRVFRSTIHGRLDCGYLTKQGARHGYFNRIEQDYIGVFVLEGSGQFIDADGLEYRAESGCLLQHMPGLSYSVVPNEGEIWREFFFRVPVPLCNALAELKVVDSARAVLQLGAGPELTERFDSLLMLVRTADDTDISGVLVRLHDLLTTLYRLDAGHRGPGPYAKMVREASAVLGNQLGTDMDMHALAGRFNLSYERFRKVFREEVGVSPGEYRIRRRIDRAHTLLVQDRASVKRVAFELGYADPFTFSKQFKKYAGISPSSLRGTRS